MCAGGEGGCQLGEAQCLEKIERWRKDSARRVDADRRLEEDVGGGRRGVGFAPWSGPVVTWASELAGQGLGPGGLGGTVARFSAMAIFWPFLPF